MASTALQLHPVRTDPLEPAEAAPIHRAAPADDVTPYEHRKLWLLNGGHSLLAYAGSIRGHASVAEAVADDTCRDWLQQWWQVASRHLEQPEADLAAYRRALLDRFANPRKVVAPLAAGPLRDAVPGILRSLDPALGDDADLIVTVLHQCEQMEMEAKS